MTHPEDMKRQWDGLENCSAGKMFIAATDSARRIANLGKPERTPVDGEGIVRGSAYCLAFWGFVIIAWFAWSQR